VKTERDGDTPLKLLDLSPRDGEVGVAVDTDVVAVFSVPVVLGEDPAYVNDNTFYITDSQGTQLNVVPEMSPLDLVEGEEYMGGTVILHLEGLTPGASYTVVVAGTLEGAAPYVTTPLGVDVEATFQVGQ
jgi:hypothetical protein